MSRSFDWGKAAEEVFGGESIFGTRTPYQVYLDLQGRPETDAEIERATGRPISLRGKTHPGKTFITGTDGRVYEYRSAGQAVLTTLDMTGYRKVCRVASALTGGGTTTRRTRKKTRGRRSRRRMLGMLGHAPGCGCASCASPKRRRRASSRKLSPKQLAAGFGGKRYRK
jgi:hypothetical protein